VTAAEEDKITDETEFIGVVIHDKMDDIMFYNVS
jgi:hypothetical protein